MSVGVVADGRDDRRATDVECTAAPGRWVSRAVAESRARHTRELGAQRLEAKPSNIIAMQPPLSGEVDPHAVRTDPRGANPKLAGDRDLMLLMCTHADPHPL